MKTLLLVLSLALFFASGCTVIYPGDGRAVSVSPQGRWSAAQLAELDAACRMWDAAGVHLRVSESGDGWTLPMHYESIPWWVDTGLSEAAGAYVLDNGEAWCSPRYVAEGRGLAQCLAHEIGHAIGLGHVHSGIMQRAVPDFDQLQPDDFAEHARVWP